MPHSKVPHHDLTGQRYGRLLVTGYADFDGTKHRWRCACDCGGSSVSRGNSLRSGQATSCGCVKRTRGAKNLTTHGLSQTRAHGIWKAAKSRCFNPNASNYQHYGGRGITMCERWRKDFAEFYADMGECPEGLSLDRIDHNGNYEPGNCRWTDQAQQVRNTRRTVFVEHNGITMVAKDYCKATGKSYNGELVRLRRARQTQPQAPAST